MIHLITLTVVVFGLIVPLNSLIVEGVISTEEDWKFITRFCYLSQNGQVQYTFEYPKEDYCCQDAILYYDKQWDSVYPQPQKSCIDKHKVADSKRNQILPLNPDELGSGCYLKTDKDEEIIVCSDFRKLSSIRPRWWYLVVSNCGSEKGLLLKYKMIMTNGDSFWTKHFSADEQNILETDIFFACLLIILMFATLYTAYLLSRDQLFHSTFRLFIWATFFEVFSVIVNVIYYVDYGETGKPRKGIKNIGRGCHCISDTIFLVLLVLLGKGWTVTRARISPSGQIKLAVFCTLYSIAYIALFIYESKAFDPGQVLYIYESPAGAGICIMKVIAWIWFCYGIYFTLKNYERKRLFYYPFLFVYSLWFLSGPILVLIATEVIEPHKREQIMNGVDRMVLFLAFAVFLMLTRPSSANKNFPYHVRTTQIGIADDGGNQNFEGCTYKPANESVHLQRNVATLFAVNGATQSQGNNNNNETSGLWPSADGEDRSPRGRDLNFTNPGYTDAKDSPPNYSQSVVASAPLPAYGDISQPGVGAGNFVNAQGDMLRQRQQQRQQQLQQKRQQQQQLEQQQQQQQQQHQQQAQQQPVSTLVRTEQQLTSMFKAKSSLSPNPDMYREPSPNFLIPEPDSQFSPNLNGTISPPLASTTPTTNDRLTLDQQQPSPLSTTQSSPTASLTNLLSPQHTSNLTHQQQQQQQQQQQDNSQKFTVQDEKAQYETTEEAVHNNQSHHSNNSNAIPSDSNNINNSNDPSSNVEEGKRKKKKKRGKRGTLRKEDVEAIFEAIATPKTLDPIIGLNRQKLSPLRGGALPPLSK